MNRQEVFNQVYSYALTMEKPAINSESKCMYRSSNGPCLIGSLIKDDFYKPELEDCRPYDDNVKEALISSGVTVRNKSDVHFLYNLQRKHDDVSNYFSFKEDMLKGLGELASEYNIKVPKVTA